jgi:mycothiol S-conjugate amidase
LTSAPLGTDGTLRLMAVHAHPDDESSKGAATTARYAAEGVEVLVVTCTGGERGDILNPTYQVPQGYEFETIEGKRAVRRLEMAAAAQALGVRQHWLGFTDSGLPEGDPLPPLPEDAFALVPLEQAAAPLVEAVRRFRPHVITTYDPSGGYPHPDHVYCHTVSMEAWEAAGDPARYVVEGGAEPWTPLKLYYNHGFSLARLRAVHEAMEGLGLESPFGDWIESRTAREIPERPVTTLVPVAQYFPARDAALTAHASQIDPAGFFFAVPRDIEADVWPWEEYELAASRVPVEDREDDLFAGIRGTEAAR